MIEVLCIAAEVTAVLLILSIAIPSAATKHAQRPMSDDVSLANSSVLSECEPSLMALRSLLYWQGSQTAQTAFAQTREGAFEDQVLTNLRQHLDATEPLYPHSARDAVSSLANLQDLDRLLDAFAHWASLATEATWIGLIQVDRLEELDDQHGPLGSERMIREIALFLRDRVGGVGPLVRFNQNTFAIVLFDWPSSLAVEYVESLRKEIAKRTAAVGEATIQTTASVSLVAYDCSKNREEHWEQLEDGIADAVAAGANRGRWFDVSVSEWKPMGDESVDEEATHASLDHAVEAPTDAASAVAMDESTKEGGSDHSADESAVSEADIASLFQAAKHQVGMSNEVKSAKELSATAADDPPSVRASKGTEAEDAEGTGDDASALQNDIEALFEAARMRPRSQTNSLPQTAPLEKAPAKPVAEDEDEPAGAATNDDIESLFKAFQKTK